MIRGVALRVLLALAGLVPFTTGGALYEEDLLASAPIRVAQWRQLEAYAAALPIPQGSVLSALPNQPTTAELRQSFRQLLGYPPAGFLAAPTARMDRVGEDEVATYFRCYVRVAPFLETYGLYIIPKRAAHPMPLVVALHGGSGYPELATFHGGTNYHDMVRGAVAEGYVVFVPLTLMWPARDRDHGTPIPSDVRTRVDEQLRVKGATLMGVEVAKVSRALDPLRLRSEVDRRRVGMIGLSYGGYYTLYAAALDARICVAVVAGCFSDRSRNDPRRPERPRKPIDLSSIELARLISPRPLQVQAGVHDTQHPVDEARRAAALAARYYDGVRQADFDFEVFDGGHEFRGALAWPFLRKYLRTADVP